VIVRDFDVVGISVLPDKANSILIVDPNTVLTPPAARQPFESISRWQCQLLEIFHPI
jgi:hypothetical protein